MPLNFVEFLVEHYQDTPPVIDTTDFSASSSAGISNNGESAVLPTFLRKH